MKILCSMLITFFLCGCGGGGPGGEPPVPRLKTAFINPSDAIIPAGDSYDYRIAVVEDANPITSAAYQATQSGELIAWPGRTREVGFGGFSAFLDEVVKYPAFKYVYLYDELGLGHGRPVDELHLEDQTAVLAASVQVRERGLKSMVIYFPNAVLNPAFTLGVANGIDIIGLDIYPNIMPTFSVPNLYPGNPYKNYLAAMVTKLRGMGFTGEIWYVYQAFDIVGNDPVWFTAELVKQRAAIDDALDLGITGIVPFGMYLGAGELEREPNLIPLEDTQPLVIP
jgi:hypothetical protein